MRSWIAQHHGAGNTKLTYQTALHHVGAAIGGLSPGKVTRKQSLRGPPRQ
jgi:hypothetical protein